MALRQGSTAMASKRMISQKVNAVSKIKIMTIVKAVLSE
jgi:hypothetical protein